MLIGRLDLQIDVVTISISMNINGGKFDLTSVGLSSITSSKFKISNSNIPTELIAKAVHLRSTTLPSINPAALQKPQP
jgi:hypothetical protein